MNLQERDSPYSTYMQVRKKCPGNLILQEGHFRPLVAEAVALQMLALKL